MNEFKRCSGYKGHWECADDYSDHMVPVDEFGKGMNLCGRCKTRYDSIRNPTRERHPVTGQFKMDWKTAKAINLGGDIKNRHTPEWKSFLDKAEIMYAEEFKNHLLNTAPGEEVIAYIKKSEFGQSTPMTKRVSTEVEGEKVPEGWVYVVRNPDVPHILKIGKTFPDGIASIMSDARRFGRAELLHKCWFWKAYKSEQSIHRALKKYNLRALGYTDCGKELFKCSIDIAMSAILAECEDTEDAA